MKKIIVLRFVSVLFLSCFSSQEKLPCSHGYDWAAWSEPVEDPSPASHPLQMGTQGGSFPASAGFLSIGCNWSCRLENRFLIGFWKEGIDNYIILPLMISFPGGAGSSLIRLPQEAQESKRGKIGDEGIPFPPPYPLMVNPDAWMELTDLVFFHSVGIGGCPPVTREEGERVWGVQEDVYRGTEFIRRDAARNQRWSLPKFLRGGRSCFPCPALSGYLRSTVWTSPDGISRVSSIFNCKNTCSAIGTNLCSMLFLPGTYRYHRKSLKKFKRDATAFFPSNVGSTRSGTRIQVYSGDGGKNRISKAIL